MQLHRWIACQSRYWTDLVTHPREQIFDIFEDLASRSEHSAIRAIGYFEPHLNAISAFNPPYPGLPLASDLDNEWRQYRASWQGFLSRNPYAHIADLLVDVSESHDASSFPAGYEAAIEKWVRTGFTGERPFDDRAGIDTADWRQELTQAAEQAGTGWVLLEDGRLTRR